MKKIIITAMLLALAAGCATEPAVKFVTIDPREITIPWLSEQAEEAADVCMDRMREIAAQIQRGEVEPMDPVMLYAACMFAQGAYRAVAQPPESY
jgi:hypothetical protein